MKFSFFISLYINIRGVQMSYSFWNNDHTKNTKINLQVNSNWKELASNVDNKYFTSIWNMIDNNDGIVQENELNLFQKLIKIADKLIDSSKDNKVIENDEAQELIRKINRNELIDELKNNPIGTINTSKTKLSNYSYIDFMNSEQFDKPSNAHKPRIVTVDFSKLEKNKTYNIIGYNRKENADGTITEYPIARELLESQVGKKSNWSEGLDRKITTIQVTSDQRESELIEKVIPELNAIGAEVGFNVQTINGGDTWLEDYSIMLNDGYRYSPNDNFKIKRNDENITNSDRYKSGIISQQGQVNRNKVADKYANNYHEEDIVRGKTYLEGGNVLNTCKKDGTPAAIVGEDSIYYTLQAMGLESNDENIEKEKKQIAQDLHLEQENITFIPQLDFHIDMSYRPLQNGEIAIPDYNQGINILKNTNISSMTDETKNKLIEKLTYLKEKTDSIVATTEEKLANDGYKIIKIPCFSDIEVLDFENLNNGATIKGVNPINYMNGVGGTASNSNKGTFYITNTSGYPELDNVMENYFKQIGIDKTYFVSTMSFLKRNGGIDCLTQEF